MINIYFSENELFPKNRPNKSIFLLKMQCVGGKWKCFCRTTLRMRVFLSSHPSLILSFSLCHFVSRFRISCLLCYIFPSCALLVLKFALVFCKYIFKLGRCEEFTWRIFSFFINKLNRIEWAWSASLLGCSLPALWISIAALWLLSLSLL